MTGKRALIFANGNLSDVEAARCMIRDDDTLISADGGTRHLFNMNLVPQIVVGDLDSLNEIEKDKLATAGVRIEHARRDKDETDLELAVRHALVEGHEVIRIVGALGGRIDHTLGNLALLSDPSLAGVDLRLDDGIQEALLVRERADLLGKVGDIVSLLPWGGDVTGITTEGLKWSLKDEILFGHRTRGISNEMLGSKACVKIKKGLLLILHQRSFVDK